MLGTNIGMLAAAMAASVCAVSAQGALVGHYEFEETDATDGNILADSSGNGHTLTIVNPSDSGDLNVAGVIGSAYEPGSKGSDYAARTNGTSDFGITGNNARTIALWFNTSSFGGATDQYRLVGSGTGAAAESFDIVAESGTNANSNDGNATAENRVGLRYGNGNVYFNADNSGNDFDINTWYHIAFVYDGTTLDLESIGTTSDSTGLIVYVNGVEVNTAAGNLSNSTQVLNTGADNFALGIRSDLNGSFGNYPGLLDDVRVYDQALSANEVAALVPEPGSLALLGLGGLLIGSRRRRG